MNASQIKATQIIATLINISQEMPAFELFNVSRQEDSDLSLLFI